MEDATIEIPPDAPRPRLCHLRKWPDFSGYGFNLHAEKGKPGQYVGKIDAGSPAEAAGLREGDRIVEVNGTNIGLENHGQVVQRIKAVDDEAKFLVVDRETDEYYRERKIVVSSRMLNVDFYETPARDAAADGSDSDSGRVGDVREQNGSVVQGGPDSEASVTTSSGDTDSHSHRARQCQLRTWPDFGGYGFNLHAERGKPEQYIGHVDAGSPAEAAGLREGDRIVAVNGEDVVGLPHQDVVRRIRAVTDRVTLVVIDATADAYFREVGVTVSASMKQIETIVCPEVNPRAAAVSATADVAGPAVVASASAAVVATPPPQPLQQLSAEHRPRLCHVRSWQDGRGFGFNMQAERGKPGQYIGKVDSGSPAEAAGLREGDRIVEVNGTNVEQDTHRQVVDKIKAIRDETRLLVVDFVGDRYFAESGITISSQLDCVEHIVCPERKPLTENGKSGEVDNEQAGANESKVVTDGIAKVALSSENVNNESPRNSSRESTSSGGSTPQLETPSSTAMTAAPLTLSAMSPKSPVVVSGLEFAASAEEARRRMAKKRDVRSTGMSIKDKYDLFQKL